MESISEGETSIKEFLALVDESIKESNRCQFLKGLNNKTKLTIYKTFGGEVKFKRYLNGVGDAGTRLLFKLRSGTHGLNEELGRHRGREGKYMCNLCGEDCESVGPNGKRKVNQLNNIIRNRYINLSARRMLLLSVLRPSLEYGSEVWEGNKSQAASLESIMLGGAKRVLGCSSKTSNEAIWGDMGLEFLQGRRDKRKLSWWYKVVNMPLSRYPKQIFQEEWNIKPRPGRQRKVWKRVVDDIFESLELDKGEWVESISEGETSIKEFLALVDESIKESNRCQFLKGLNNKTKLTIYKTFGGEVKFKRYLNGVGVAGTRLLFKLRSGTHGLNEELGRHRGREGKYMCNLCGEDCESVGHFLWNCPVYSERRALFLEHLKNNLGNEFEHFKNCDTAGKSHFILGTELWGSRYEELLRLVKSYIIDIWELRKTKLYGSGTGPLQYRSRPGRDTTCQGKGKFGKLGGEKSCIVVYGSARSSECEAHGPSATATI